MASNTQTPTAAQAAGQATMAQAKAKGLTWVPGYGYKGLTGTKAIMAKHGLNYSQWYLAYMAACMPASERFATAGASEAAIQAFVVKARSTQGQSWGYIMARTGLSEGRVRAAFTAGTKVQTLGLRNGRGGRMVQGGTGKPLAKLYTGVNNKALGSEVPVGKPLATATATTKHKVSGAAPKPVAAARKA